MLTKSEAQSLARAPHIDMLPSEADLIGDIARCISIAEMPLRKKIVLGYVVQQPVDPWLARALESILLLQFKLHRLAKHARWQAKAAAKVRDSLTGKQP